MEIPIFLTIDNGYAPYADCAIRSMVENASKDRQYRIFVLHEDLTEDSMEKIRTGVKEPFSIEFIPMKDKITGINERQENKLRCDYFTMTIFFRLFIADMFPQYDKGIYIDSDVIVPGDISELYDTDLEGNLFAACVDHSIANIPPFVKYVDEVVGVDVHKYINSGILVMGLKDLRERGFADHFMNLLSTYHFDSVAPDQDYLNAICNGQIKFLDIEWDAMPPETGVEDILENPKIIHYNLFMKPWSYDNIGYGDLFWEVARKSPFYDLIVEHKENYSDEQKASDKEAIETMLGHSQEICEMDVTFEKMRKAGVKIRI